MKVPHQEFVLPNGRQIFCLRPDEVPILYEQVQEYLKHGVKVCRGDTVFDVGANIGLFSIWLNHQLANDLRIYAFEPIPSIFEVLRLNAERVGTEKFMAFSYGLSRESGFATFGYFPSATPLSSAYPDGSKPERDKFKRAVLTNLEEAPPKIRRLRCFPPFLRSLVLDYELKRVFQYEQVTCELRTLSEVIQEQEITEIDLLKIDVEKSELDVLLGIEVHDWPKIKQVVIEVHDIKNRVEQITALLEKVGFTSLMVEQEPSLKETDIFSVYAVRYQLRV